MNKYRYKALILGSSLAIAGSAFAGVALAGGGDCDKAGGHAGRGAARFEHIDSNGDGKVDLAELTASREGWLTRVDTNKDGVASQAEIEASMASKRQQHLQKMFEREDANKDGRLTREETRLPSAWFEKADANKDGALTFAELGNVHNQAPRDKHAGKAGRFDQNADGQVDRQELHTAVANQFAQLDENNDGSLTSDELRAQRQGKHRRRHGNGADAPAARPAPTRS
jgi:Ca2+-binding EF-hand superfamily protein